jgi:long-subunit acyl-CoA synthetase (AMP-forming)/N-acetylglutamate synthase-like GNAT family acetyltransferase
VATEAERVIQALEEGLDAFRAARTDRDTGAARDLILHILEAGRWPDFLKKIAGTALAQRWLGAVLTAIEAADLTIGDVLRVRTAQNTVRPFVRIPNGREVRDVSRGEIGARVAALGAAITGRLVKSHARVPIAIFSPNRLETMLVDLACLSHGIVNVPIASDATPDQIRFILEQTGAEILFVSDTRRLEGAQTGGALPGVKTVILFDPPEGSRTDRRVIQLAEVEEEGRQMGPVVSRRPRAGDLATVMFTSGTTGRPKGIRFSHRDILYKRFCRAVALPAIGEADTFLCYLPLFHTFGRWLEMTGCLFWGSTYVAMENPSLESMLGNLRRFQPSVFISIPKRWIQLHEKIVQLAGTDPDDPDMPDPLRIGDAVADVTGGRLRWGLSAAGYLDADIFLFFQRHGIELLSGFGMTEATGGITMTPPGRYRRGTVGVALPGIEVRRAEDGELLCRGPYMMIGYDDPDEPERDYRTDWFGTGDLVTQDDDGYVTIIDRKKDIYKNVKGQTVAPQRIENMFTEFEEIKRVFLVGDGREYNTLLIYPDYDAAGGKLARMSPDELREYLSSFVVSVNRFLAPFERVVDFDLMPRYFREDKGELTPKGTFVRKVVERNFSDMIDALYARAYVTLRLERIEVRFPTWLLREKGITADALVSEPGGIRLRNSGERLAIGRVAGSAGHMRVGSFLYAIGAGDREGPATVDLDPLLQVPRYWVGNAELAHFAGESVIRRPRRGAEPSARITVEGWQRPVLLLDDARARFDRVTREQERGASGVHAAAALLLAAQGADAKRAIKALEAHLDDPTSEEAAQVRAVLPLLRFHADGEIRRRALALLLPREVDEGAGETIRRFIAVDPDVLTPEVASSVLDIDMPAAALRSLLDIARDLDIGSDPWKVAAGRRRVISVLRLVTDLAARQPRWYAPVRQTLVGRAISERDIEIAGVARAERVRIDGHFRFWIASGPTQPLDPLHAQPMGWEEVVGFDERCEARIRSRLLDAFRETTLLRETVFLLGEGTLLSGADLLPGGIWVSPLGTSDGRASVRVAARTRGGRSHEFVVRILDDAPDEGVAGEIDCMIHLGSGGERRKLVAEIGGFWPERGIWTEEQVDDEPVGALIRRMLSSDDAEAPSRLAVLWPHLVWSSLTAFFDFWNRNGRRSVIVDTEVANIAIAAHDYQESSRLISVSRREPFGSLAALVRRMYERFVDAAEQEFPILRDVAPRRIAFSSVIEALGEADAIPLLWRSLVEMRDLVRDAGDAAWNAWRTDLAEFLDEIEREGFAPRRLVMAVRRYHTWAGLNPGASLQARAVMLQELYETYGLASMEGEHPELRVRFFRLTAFARARTPLAVELDALIRAHRDTPLSLEALLRRMTILHRTLGLDEEETYFLARMTYAHLRPAQRVRLELLEEGGETKAELVEEIRDDDGVAMKIRSAANPKEIMRLYRLFENAGLAVTFRPEHRFLLILDDAEHVVGGLFYRMAGRSSVHMEKIVVGPRQRGKGVGEKLMENFLQRARDAGQTSVTTGFFRPHYFYRFGFRLEKGFAGLVKDLDDSRSADAKVDAAP